MLFRQMYSVQKSSSTTLTEGTMVGYFFSQQLVSTIDTYQALFFIYFSQKCINKLLYYYLYP